jgi:hypothetical protein
LDNFCTFHSWLKKNVIGLTLVLEICQDYAAYEGELVAARKRRKDKFKRPRLMGPGPSGFAQPSVRTSGPPAQGSRSSNASPSRFSSADGRGGAGCGTRFPGLGSPGQAGRGRGQGQGAKDSRLVSVPPVE